MRKHISDPKPGSFSAAPRGVIAVRVCVILAAAVFIVLGAINGGADDVMKKAVNICAECIGLG